MGRMAKTVDPSELRSAMAAVAGWAAAPAGAPGADPRADDVAPPSRGELAAAVRQSARMLAQEAPGHSVELRVPPFVAVQCIEGPRHTRGTPPNVVEVPPRLWLRLALGLTDFADALPHMDVSGTRAGELAAHLPVARLGPSARG